MLLRVVFELSTVPTLLMDNISLLLGPALLLCVRIPGRDDRQREARNVLLGLEGVIVLLVVHGALGEVGILGEVVRGINDVLATVMMDA